LSSTTRGTPEPDERCLNAFVVARGLLDHGTLGLDGTAPSAIGAAILYDVAVETAAKATLRVRPPASFPGVGYVIRQARRSDQGREFLPWVLDQLLASYRELREEDQADLPALHEARHLHEYRNTVQHQGTVPSPQDVERQRFRADDFISSLARNFLGRELAELSRAMLVQDKSVRGAIQEAEQRLAGGYLLAAVEQVSIAFEVAREAFRSGQPFEYGKSVDVRDVRRAIRGIEESIRPSGNRSSPRFGGSWAKLQEVLEALVRRSTRAEDRLEALSLGAQASDYVWFRNRFPRARGFLGSEEWEAYWTVDPSEVRFTREEAIRGLDFVTTVALHWQQSPPALPPASDEDLDPV
jgi:hypothetical protein